MRNTKPILLILLIALVAVNFTAGTILAQDPLKVAPTMYKLVTENARVRVMEVTFKPGEQIATHSHPDHLAYFLSGGTLKITANGKTNEVIGKAGDPVWIPAETHSAVNTGKTEVKVLVLELKEPAPAPAKK
jgi:quercetin dioxygenase-like cupin family protein